MSEELRHKLANPQTSVETIIVDDSAMQAFRNRSELVVNLYVLFLIPV